MKPGVSAATTGVLPIRRARYATVSVTAGSVIGPGITSTSAISGTGLKKCMPMTRAGCAVAEAMRATASELVLVARMVPATATASRRRNASRLRSRSSGIASITISATARPSSMADVPSRPTAATSPSSVSWPFSTLRARNPPMRSMRPIGRAGHRIVEQHLEPCLRGNLGNARAHRAGPEDADRRDLVHRPPNSGSRFSANAATPSA